MENLKEDLYNVWIDLFKVFVSIPKFQRGEGEANWNNRIVDDARTGDGSSANPRLGRKDGQALGKMEFSSDGNWKNTLLRGLKVGYPTAPVKDKVSEWLSRERCFLVEVVLLGGKKVLLKENVEDDVLDLLKDGKELRDSMFQSVLKWSPQILPKDRMVWIKVVDLTSKKKRLDVGFFLVATFVFSRIESKVDVKVDGTVLETLLLEDSVYWLLEVSNQRWLLSVRGKETNGEDLDGFEVRLWLGEGSCWGEHVVGGEEDDEVSVMFLHKEVGGLCSSGVVSRSSLENHYAPVSRVRLSIDTNPDLHLALDVNKKKNNIERVWGMGKSLEGVKEVGDCECGKEDLGSLGGHLVSANLDNEIVRGMSLVEGGVEVVVEKEGAFRDHGGILENNLINYRS
ncbi:unnamed protein product [Lupinus luteus]|uniref:DUF4283 domain-containing protein n=1 Tax=Lupinus luteus TaxID=3873 RepID=A0AAV1W1Q1_LUPLU